MNVTPSQFDLLWKLMDATELRHRVISQNVANVNTPGYRRMDVSFEEELAQRVAEKSPPNLDLTDLQPEIHEVEGLPVRADGNNVDIDKEMGSLGKNALLHQVYTQLMASKLGLMRSAISGQ